jgi:uncharacterized membrane protein
VKNKLQTALLAGSTVWCFSLIAAPVFGLSFVYAFFSRICHQDPARSWHLMGSPLPVCVRCASIYFAFTLSLWFGLKANTRRLRWALVFMFCEFVVARLLVDVAFLRSVSGIFVGLAAAPFVKQGLEEIRDAM